MNVQDVEEVILDKFKTEPFHNLYLLTKKMPKSLKYGGTCSDKTLSTLYDLKNLGVDARLHSSFIDGKEVHRLVCIEIEGKIYFADVGNGWPSIKLFPKDREITYSCYGIKYRSAIDNNYLSIYQTRRGRERLSTVIPFHSKSEQEIMHDIENRFDGSVEYPFSKGLRFSLIVQDRFLFLRDDTLYFFSEKVNIADITGISDNNSFAVIKKYFGFDVDVLFAE